MSLHPTVLWAQRTGILYLTIDLPDVQKEKVSITEKKLEFSGTSGGHDYALDLDFAKEINAEESKFVVRPRGIKLTIVKKEEAWWPYLLANKAKPAFVKVDWSLWKDEDEEEEAAPNVPDFGDFGGGADFGDMSNLGLGGGDDDLGNAEDSDDEELPDLESKDGSKAEEVQEGAPEATTA